MKIAIVTQTKVVQNIEHSLQSMVDFLSDKWNFQIDEVLCLPTEHYVDGADYANKSLIKIKYHDNINELLDECQWFIGFTNDLKEGERDYVLDVYRKCKNRNIPTSLYTPCFENFFLTSFNEKDTLPKVVFAKYAIETIGTIIDGELPKKKINSRYAVESTVLDSSVYETFEINVNNEIN